MEAFQKELVGQDGNTTLSDAMKTYFAEQGDPSQQGTRYDKNGNAEESTAGGEYTKDKAIPERSLTPTTPANERP